MRLKLGEIADIPSLAPVTVICGGTRQKPDGGKLWADTIAGGGQIDSRLVAPGDLFFCLPGEKADGHDFVRAAAGAGASAIIAARNPFGLNWPTDFETPVFIVPDVKMALWQIAMRHRDDSRARVIGITGTAGKTSVKEVLAGILAAHGHTCRNIKNHNNQIGLPISMLNASVDAAFWVMEAGISEEGDMQELGAILRPDVALVLNVGAAHVQGLGGRGVAACKALLLDYVRPGGMAVVSADYPDLTAETLARGKDMDGGNINLIAFSATGRKVRFSARHRGTTPEGRGLYEARDNDTVFMVETPFTGDFGAENVAAIVAVATMLGCDTFEMRQGFLRARLPEQRFNIAEYATCTLIDDSYNANPLSAMRMILAARGMAEERNRNLVLVMGEMLELGEQAAQAHRELGRGMGKARATVVFWNGGHVEDVAAGLDESGYQGQFYQVTGEQDFSQLLEETKLDNTLLLFKGSRANRLERFVEKTRFRLNAEGKGDAI